jgi:hypothetical protein
MSNPLEVAAIPTAVAILKAAQQLLANLGTDPLQIAAKAPGAFQIFVGTVEMQAPALVTSELGAVQTDVNSTIDGWITKLEAVAAPAAA